MKDTDAKKNHDFSMTVHRCVFGEQLESVSQTTSLIPITTFVDDVHSHDRFYVVERSANNSKAGILKSFNMAKDLFQHYTTESQGTFQWVGEIIHHSRRRGRERAADHRCVEVASLWMASMVLTRRGKDHVAGIYCETVVRGVVLKHFNSGTEEASSDDSEEFNECEALVRVNKCEHASG